MRQPGDGKRARLTVVHRCFSEGSDSILSAFSLGAFASEAARQLTSFSG